ncbi:thioredoxin domain-containing protein [Solirubrobacter sp. CPCC 204708]|uniref:DsbA family protein n=1 Tax=Solirubrobacter deserti TaxID=2282478 RepID=A0ABT4REX0_9ACTN|nr:thioredoxin domain-containing protein [Solirubrobacter deserti]MBE2316120.1 thioredoxin domain-containing protein [Solirubrobacter deserti]MDA0136870.1 DsbA family protein [Solirubrobacter deserti]
MTKRELREQARAHRLALEAAEAARTTRRRRFSILGAALAAAIAVIVVAALVSTNSNSDAAPSGDLVRSTVVDGVPERNGVLGDPNAPVTVTEYVDLQCPVCAEASKTALPALINDYVKTGKVKLELRTMHFLGPDSVKSARVAAGAQQQNKLWSFVETFYANQGTENSGYATDEFLRDVATTAGVDADAALDYADTDASEQALTKANQAAQAIGADSTPTFTITQDGQEKVLLVGAGDVSAELEKAL